MVESDHQRSYPRFSDAEYERRLTAVRAMMQREGVDALVIYANSKGQCSNIHYLANYLGQFHNYLVVFADPDEDPTLFVGLTNHVEYGREVSVIEDVRWGRFPPMETIVERIEQTTAATGRIGLVGPSPRFDILLPHGHYRTIEESLDADLVDVSGAYGSIQLHKSDEELDRIRTASGFVDNAMKALSETVSPGTYEYELRNSAQNAYLPDGGSPGISFVSTAPMRDPEPWACYPWKDEPAAVRIDRGDIVTTEISAGYWGYKGQIHRPIAVGDSPPPVYESLFTTVLEVHENLLDALGPGATAQDIVDATRPITEAGYQSPDAILHGYGMSLHPPWIGTIDSNYWPNLEDQHMVPNDEFEFAEDMVVVIQPNAMTDDGRYGLQFGSTVHITDSGSTLLTEYPLEFIQV